MKSYGVPPSNRHSMPPGRTAFGPGVSVVDGSHAERERAHENPTVHSKADRRYGKKVAQPAELYRDPVSGDSPITHHNEPFRPHVETVGHQPDGSGFKRATHPNAEAKAAGNAVHTHQPLEPVGQTHSKYGGEHGEPQTPPRAIRVAADVRPRTPRSIIRATATANRSLQT